MNLLESCSHCISSLHPLGLCFFLVILFLQTLCYLLPRIITYPGIHVFAIVNQKRYLGEFIKLYTT